MAKPSAEAPRRWAEEAESTDDAPLAELFRAVDNPQPLSAAALARVHDRLGSKLASPATRRMRELVMAVGMVLLGSSLALAGWGASEWVIGRSQEEPQLVPKTAAQPVARAPGGAHLPKKSQLAVAAPAAEEPAPATSSSGSDAPLEPTASKATAT